MSRLKQIGAAIVLSVGLAGTAQAQAQATVPLTPRDVVGDWTLQITPAERRGFSISIQAADGGSPDLDLTVAARTASDLTCTLHGDPAECEIDDGHLVVTSAKRGARMTFTLTQRTATGFAGAARFNARLLPFGNGHIGSVTMTRR